MTKRKRYTKPDDQKTISAFFGGATSAVITTRVAEEERPEKRPRVPTAATDGPSGEGGAPAPSATETEAGPQPAQSTLSAAGSTRSEATNDAAAPVTVNREAFMKETAERAQQFVRTSKHKIGWNPEWKKFKWLVPVKDEAGNIVGMLCSTCRRHNQRQWNGQMYWSKLPVSSLRIDTIMGHFEGYQHDQATRKETARLASARNGGIAQAFQREVSIQREALTTAMKTLYFLAKEEIAHTTKYSSLLDFAKDHLGCDVLSHLSQGGNANYRSERILKELLLTMAKQLQSAHRSLLGTSTFFGLQVDETTDITTTKELVLLTRFVVAGEVVNRFAGMVEVPDGKAATISAAILAWIQEKGLDVQKLMGFGSDGAPVMTGKRNGVATLLKAQSKLLVAIHCIAHRLALAAGQAGEAVAYFKNRFKPNLGELFRFYDNSACRMARLHQIQDMLDIIQTTMKEAVDTRWLSHDEACKALYKSLPAVLMSLDHEAKNNATAFGLLAWMKDYQTLATLYLLCDLLPHLSALSRCFQHAKINLLQIHRSVQTTVAVVRGMRDGIRAGSRLSKLEQDLSAGGRLEEFSISMSPGLKLKWQKEVREPFIDHLLQNLQERFASTQLLSSFAILDPSLMPQPMPEDYGFAEVECIVAHYGGEVGGIVEPDALWDEWYSLREYIRQNNHLSQEQLVKLLLTETTLAELYPSMKLLASVLMVIPVSTADSERSFSTLKRVKTRLRSRMTNDTLNALLTISIDGPSVNDFDFESAVTAWGAMRNRRIAL